jgi:hypothetical protein
MMRNYFSFLLILIVSSAFSQELNCKVTVDYSKVSATNVQVFKTLETSLNDFVNKTSWTEKKYNSNEKINCSMFILINEYDSSNFNATIQVGSSRTIYNSTYESPVLNVNDKDMQFKYVEFENLIYSPTSFESNLVSIISFYSNLIIAIDAESLAPNGGDEYFLKAQDILSLAAQGGYKGWSQADGNQNRYFLINDLISPSFKSYKEVMTQYHFKGLDRMSDDLKGGKEELKNAIIGLSKIYAIRPNAYLLRIFFDAKADEIVSIFSGGPSIPISDLVDTLNRISPTNSSKWSKIKA